MLQCVMTAFALQLQDCINDMVVNIQTVMTQINSHGHGMHVIVLIKFSHFALHCYFISKTAVVFDALSIRDQALMQSVMPLKKENNRRNTPKRTYCTTKYDVITLFYFNNPFHVQEIEIG